MIDERSPYQRKVPVLTDVVDDAPPERGPAERRRPAEPLIDETRLAELQTELAARTYQLADQLLHAAFTEMEAALFEEVSNRLRKELPDLIDRILREQLGHPS